MKINRFMLVVLLFCALCGCGDWSLGPKLPKGLYMSYRLDNAYMDYKYFQVDITQTGDCRITYREVDEGSVQKPEKVINMQVPVMTIEKMLELYKELDYFNYQPQDLNKDTITVKEVGTTTMFYAVGGKSRKLSYGYIKDKTLAKLTGMFWNIASQAIKREDKLHPSQPDNSPASAK